MSAIAGLFYLDGRPARSELISQMVDAMRHRGPDRQDTWVHAAVGLGHGMLETTPESLHERLPWEHPQSGCVITADARIDNRDELMAALRLRPASDEIVPDSTLILYAYEKWGEDCVDHLLGDFAFTIWDPNEQRLFCARDHMGVRPFYYFHQPNGVFVCASEIKALLTLNAVPRRLNEVRIADYLATMYEDKEVTEYEEIWRLPPGHVLTIDTSTPTLKKRQYWELERGPTIQMESNQAYAEQFRELMTEAVRCRMRSQKPVATELSGGLDSSFVTCLARDISDGPIHTISLLFPSTPTTDEREYIKAVLDTSDAFIPHAVNSADQGFMEELGEICQHIDEGVFLSGAHYMMWQNYRAARETGARILLTGVDGDSVVDHGTLYLSELAKQGQWERFATEVKQLAQRNAEIGETQEFLAELASPQKMIDRYGRPYLKRAIREHGYTRFYSATRILLNQLPISAYWLYRSFAGDFVRSLIGETEFKRVRGHPSIANGRKLLPQIESLKAEFADQVNYFSRYESRKRNNLDAVREEQIQLLNSGVFTTTLEACNHYTSAHSVEAAHPFMDVRLLEFAVCLPSEQSLSEGWTRAILRRAMNQIVPDKVRLRQAKANIHPVVMKQINFYDKERLSEFVQDPGLLRKYVDLDQYRELYERRHELNARGQWRITFLTNVAFWLNHCWNGVAPEQDE